MSLFDRRHRLRKLESITATLVGENDSLRIKNATLQQENRKLRRRLPDDDGRVLERARRDADLLVALYLGGLPTSRREAHAAGMSNRRWNYATGLLSLADVRRRDGSWRTSDPDTIAKRLDIATTKGISALRSRLARWGYSGKNRSR